MAADWSTPEYWRDLRPERPVGWPDEHPAPQVTTRDPRPAGAPVDPLGVRRLAALGVASGWAVKIGFSIGQHRAVKIGTYRLVECLGVYGARPPWRWYAAYERPAGTEGTGGFTCVRTAIWRLDESWRFVDGLMGDLQEFIAMPEEPNMAWFKGISAREHQKAERQKLATKNRAKAKREGQS